MASSVVSSSVIHGSEVRLARPRDVPALVEWLAHDHAVHLYFLSWLEHHAPSESRVADQQALLWEPEGRAALEGACLLMGARLALLAAPRAPGARALGAATARLGARLEHLMGEREAVDEFWGAYAPASQPRLRLAQVFYGLDHAHALPRDPCALRLARPADLDLVVGAAAAMYREELGADPASLRPAAFRALYLRRIQEGHVFLWTEDGELLFKAELSCRSERWGAQLAGVYTPPPLRGRGVARKALGALCRRLLASHARLGLYVNEGNVPALRLYERLGFEPLCPWSSLYVV